jgi:hypothetical protein
MTTLAIVLALVALVAAAVAVIALVAWRRDVAALRVRLEALDAEVVRIAGARTATAVEPEVATAAPSGPGASVPRLPTPTEFVITHLGEDDPEPERAPVKVSLTGPAFADAVVRETVVQTASLVHGVRRALAPETRNRIRFEMKREVKRSRKDRKAEMKQALREHRARQRQGMTAIPDEEGVA